MKEKTEGFRGRRGDNNTSNIPRLEPLGLLLLDFLEPGFAYTPLGSKGLKSSHL
jgi:hypothetical protein